MNVEALEQNVASAVAAWKEREGNLIMILHQIQNRYGYVPREASLQIAAQLGVPLARIYEVLTFYHYFKVNPPGRFIISVCMGTACYLKGAPTLLEEIKGILNIGEGETTPDGLFHLQVVRCLGCCGLAPVITVGDKVYSGLRKADVLDLISRCSKEAQREESVA